jgi:hypothetical protein
LLSRQAVLRLRAQPVGVRAALIASWGMWASAGAAPHRARRDEAVARSLASCKTRSTTSRTCSWAWRSWSACSTASSTPAPRSAPPRSRPLRLRAARWRARRPLRRRRGRAAAAGAASAAEAVAVAPWRATAARQTRMLGGRCVLQAWAIDWEGALHGDSLEAAWSRTQDRIFVVPTAPLSTAFHRSARRRRKPRSRAASPSAARADVLGLGRPWYKHAELLWWSRTGLTCRDVCQRLALVPESGQHAFVLRRTSVDILRCTADFCSRESGRGTTPLLSPGRTHSA